ncbi:hypothetical protein IW262DRAFT_1468884 [Armillaria fumosa]|nr:hypothetical protein IW262DRAFT_1468884 [Armillaria fumosa]
MDQLSTTIENMTMADVLLALKDAQLKNQALQEQNCWLLTVPTLLPNIARSSTPPLDTGSATSSANDSASTINTDLFAEKDSRKALEYCAMKMVVFAHVWWDRKGLFGAGVDLESARCKLNATTLTNSLDAGMLRPSKDHAAVLQLILKLYEFLPEVFRPLINATIQGEYLKLFKMMKSVGGIHWSTYINCFRSHAVVIFQDNKILLGHFQGDFDCNEDLLC